jgi:hypothetical protein
MGNCATQSTKACGKICDGLPRFAPVLPAPNYHAFLIPKLQITFQALARETITARGPKETRDLPALILSDGSTTTECK